MDDERQRMDDERQTYGRRSTIMERELVSKNHELHYWIWKKEDTTTTKTNKQKNEEKM